MRILSGTPRSVLVASATALALAACGSSSGGASPSGGTTGAPTVSNDWAVQFTGGTGGQADSSKSPISIGYINQEGGTPSFPEASAGMDAAVKYVNAELGGVKGHPIVVKKCVVQSEEDGQKCGTQMANDDSVQFVILGVASMGNKAIYSVLQGKKPILIASPSGIDDLVASDAYSYVPGGAGVVAGMAAFICSNLKNTKQIAVTYANNPGGKIVAEGFFKPLVQHCGINNVTLVGVSDSATGPDVASAIQAAGGTTADVLVTFLTVPGCIATYDALQSLGIKPTVVATGLCYGTPMTKHLQDVGAQGQVPDGWYFGDYGASYFLPNSDPAMPTYLAKIKQYGPKDVEYTGFAGYVFSDLLTSVKFMNQIGPDQLTSGAMRTAIKGFAGPVPLVAGTIKCGYSKMFPTLCGHVVGVEQYAGGKWLPTAEQVSGKAIDVAAYLGG